MQELFPTWSSIIVTGEAELGACLVDPAPAYLV